MTDRRCIEILATTVERQISKQGMGARELIALACALIERATDRVERDRQQDS